MSKTQQSAEDARWLDEVFKDVPPVDELDLEGLGRAIRELDQDPEFVADYLKGLFVTEVYNAMHERGINANQLARKWGKSRQYLSKILAEDARVNFTIETMVELMMQLGRRVELQFPKADEHTVTLRCLRKEPGDVSWPLPKQKGKYWTSYFSMPLSLPDFAEVAKMKEEEQSVA